ncbi:hypothetical protein [Haloarchaeobius sp. DYHT-AS-18]|uniref:hypothetical protein n=1 Tax=Haloarchaeobius sp. DYHT-AS-18 TaxID=3446117 RepID=UPI003EB8A6D8
MSGVQKQLDNAPWRPGYISLRDWSFSANTTGEKSVVATYAAPRPIRLREDREMDLAVPAYESFTVDGTADNTETFNLANDLLDTPVTEALVLWEDGSPVQPDSVDYANNSFDYTSSNTGTTLDVYYIPRNPASVEFEKVAPGGGSTIKQPLFEIPTAIAHTRDQSKDPLSFDLGRTPLQDAVPRKWVVQVSVNAPYTVKFEESTRGTSATNALLSVPRAQTESRIPGLKDAVKADIAGLS